MLPLEAWQEVLGFCPFAEYSRMATSKPASREFYFLLKQSLLELHFLKMFPSPALGGLWMASRDVQATYARVLFLGLFVFLHPFGFSPLLPAGQVKMQKKNPACTACRGTRSAVSPLVPKQLAKIIPLDFLCDVKVGVKVGPQGFTVSLEEMHERFALFVRAPHRLKVSILPLAFQRR